MELLLVRDTFTDKSTAGRLSVDGAVLCFTLELPVKDGLPGSAIPEGCYKVASVWSPKFGRNMPHLLGIPNRTEIEMHWGNSPEDTEGCILLGKTREPDWIGSSRAAFDAFWPLFMQGLTAGDVTITVQNATDPAGS